MITNQTDDHQAVAEIVRSSCRVKTELIETQVDAITDAVHICLRTLSRGRKLLTFGNGGSAADAQHIASEFVGRFKNDRKAFPAIALTTDTSALTAISNDYGYEHVFSRQLEGLGERGDVAIAISTSGNSANVIAGIKTCRSMGISTVALCGGGGGKLGEIADVSVCVPSTETARIQEAHVVIGHILCDLVEKSLESDRLRVHDRSVVEWEDLLRERELWRAQGRTVVWTNGCFDLLHLGHVRSLEMAKELGDILVVGINADESVASLKGTGRPILPEEDRAELLAALHAVDRVVIFHEMTPEESLRRLQPDIHCKGEDYRSEDESAVPEAAVVRAYGGRIEYLPLVSGRSTTDLVARIRTYDRALE